MGDYKSFHELNGDQLFLQHGTIESDALKILERNWNLLKVTTLSHSHFSMKQIRGQVPTLGEMVSLSDNPGSTEVK